jgi:hypothetical protein
MKITSVFISHSAAQNIEPLLSLLKSENIKSHDSFDLAAGHDIAEGILSSISRSDAVIAVLSNDLGFANVSFEIGYATALRKPMLLLLNPAASMPGFAYNMRHIVSDITDSEVLKIGIKRFLEEATKRSPSRRKDNQPKTTMNPNENTIRNLANRIAQDRATIDARTAEEIVANLLRAAAVTLVEEQSGSRDRGVDFAVWSDALQTSLGNPILIEVKAGNLDHARLQNAYERLVSQVLGSEARFGVLLYLDHSGRRFKRPANWVPSVLALDVEDFAHELLSKSFANALMEKRNSLVHGRPE